MCTEAKEKLTGKALQKNHGLGSAYCENLPRIAQPWAGVGVGVGVGVGASAGVDWRTVIRGRSHVVHAKVESASAKNDPLQQHAATVC